jgi:hypothetical protein
VEPPLTIDQTKRVGDWVEVSDKKLTRIFKILRAMPRRFRTTNRPDQSRRG